MAVRCAATTQKRCWPCRHKTSTVEAQLQKALHRVRTEAAAQGKMMRGTPNFCTGRCRSARVKHPQTPTHCVNKCTHVYARTATTEWPKSMLLCTRGTSPSIQRVHS